MELAATDERLRLTQLERTRLKYGELSYSKTIVVLPQIFRV